MRQAPLYLVTPLQLEKPGAPFQAGPDSNFVVQGGNPNLDKNLDKELEQVLSRVFLLQSPCPSSPANLDKELGQLRAAVLQALTPRFQAGNSVCLAPAETRTWTRTWTRNLTWTNFITCFPLTEHLSKFARGTWTRNLDKFYHVFSSCKATPPNLDKELGQLLATL